ncbi:hypothetical protein PRZ48_009113 [Zasmidium cellare]|uniref:Kinesin light chain n=1 Tax=Zasmidium cellare TaxID=395010 RepID=A0ABR0EI56_ZASCE|nr:hypothetical protein PRZ48_009113 [Zasmidium cellare]
MFDRGNIHDEILRLGAIGLYKTSRSHSISVPPLLRRLLAVRANGTWNDSFYRGATVILKQYGLQLHDSLVKHFEPCIIPHLPGYKTMLDKTQDETDRTFGWTCLNVARIWQRVERHQVAEELLTAAHEQLARTRGQEDRQTLEALGRLALTSKRQGDLKRAESLQLKVVRRLSRALGEDHWDTIEAMESLAKTYRDQRLNEEAAGLQQKALESRRRRPSRNPRPTLKAMFDLAEIYRCLERLDEAETLARGALEGQRSLLGEKHPKTLDSVSQLALISWD